MNRLLISKYFSDQCSDKELGQVLDWFQTQEGRTFLEEQIKKDRRRLLENENPELTTVTVREEIFKQIQKNKNGSRL